MLKLIIFDLDGVLIESKEIHFRALNKALEFYGKTPLSYEEHILRYDGLPTLTKLSKMGILSDIHDRINLKKQEYTIESLEREVTPNEKLIELFSKLYKEGYKIFVASNSIRYTVQIILLKLEILKYVHFFISNEDVSKAKPHPEMYLKCMLRAQVGPKETLIVEDSYVGRSAVHNSGALLCPVTSVIDVTYTFIKRYIEKYTKDKTVKWKSDKLKILVPMAGAGNRFIQAGYSFPKPLIDVRGKPMIQVVIDSISIEAQYIYIVQKSHFEKFNLKYLLELITPGCEVIQIDRITEGAACTTLLAKEFINDNNDLLIVNSDQWIRWDSSDFMYSIQGKDINGAIPTFCNTHPKWSYVKLDDSGFIIDVKEKMPISNKATVGIYYWKCGSDYVKYAEQMIRKNIRINNEFYVAPVYNEAIADGFKIKPYDVEEMWGLGVPEDLQYFLSNHETI